MALKTIPFDAAPYLGDPIAQAELLDDALQSGDASYIGEALAAIMRARAPSIDTGGAAYADDENPPQTDIDPRLSTLLEVARDLGVRLHVVMEAAE